VKILYAGDGPIGGAANYLYGVLRTVTAQIVHLDPGQILDPDLLKKNHFDLLILSDFSCQSMPMESQKIALEQFKQGMGVLMVGGWGSFSGPFGNWHGSVIEEILPIHCKKGDDRTNFPGGAIMLPKEKASFLNSLDFKNPPVLCGLNAFIPKPAAKVLLVAREIQIKSKKLSFGAEHPLLVVHSNYGRSAAFATDVAPHWCGGLVDWGSRRLKLNVKGDIQIEVGHLYVKFLTNLARWLGGSEKI